jgi:hypothetical protein
MTTFGKEKYPMATKYDLETRYKVATALVTSGNSKTASEQTNVPASTIRHWAQNDEDFILMMQEVRSEFGERIKYGLAEIIDEANRQGLDRVRNGDFVLTKSGELMRKPMSGRDVITAGAIAFDKLRLLEGQPTEIVMHEDADEQRNRIQGLLKALSNAVTKGDEDEVARIKRRLSLPTPKKGEK